MFVTILKVDLSGSELPVIIPRNQDFTKYFSGLKVKDCINFFKDYDYAFLRNGVII